MGTELHASLELTVPIVLHLKLKTRESFERVSKRLRNVRLNADIKQKNK